MRSAVLVLLVSHTRAVFGLHWDYGVLQQTGKHCPERDSCNFGRRSRGNLEMDWRHRNCFCDSSCSTYGDCCIDAKEFEPEQQREQFGKYQCKRLRQYGDIYMRGECTHDWKVPSVQVACHNTSHAGDPLSQMPVTSLSSGVTYTNYYCAVCNGASRNVSFWKPRLECPTLLGYNSRFKNITRSFLSDNLVFRPSHGGEGQWGVNLNTLEGIPPVFHRCYVDPYLPENIEHKIRRCNRVSVTSTCSKGSSEEEEERCESYTGIVYSEDKAYRNTHCALCNNVSISSLICVKLEGRRLGFMDYFKPVSFAVLFDISGEGEQVGAESTGCTEEELWDPFFKRCRNVVCGQEGWVWSQGSCWPQGQVPGITATTTTTTTTTTVTTSISPSTTTTDLSIINSTTISTNTTTFFPTASPISTSSKPLSTTTTEITTTTTTTTSTKTSAVEEMSTTHNSGRIVFPTETTQRSAVNFPKSPTITTMTSTTTVTISSSTTTTSSVATSVSYSTTPLLRVTTTVHRPGPSITTPLNTSLSLVPPLPSLRSCPQVLLHPGEFSRFNNGSLWVHLHHLHLHPGQYRSGIKGSGTLYICAPDTVSSRGQAKFSPIMGYVTFACLGVSLVCLILHLFISLIAPELQNLSGKNLFSLSLALVAAYTSFLANMFTRDLSSMDCFLLAAAMYYFYLSAFFWMLNISFNVARTLKVAATELRLTSGPQWGRFLLYSFTGWCVPGLLVGGAVLLDLVPFEEIPKSYTPGFGTSSIGICWFGSRKALVIYFVIPFSVILTLNIFMFIYSACQVWDSTRNNAKITTSGPKTNFKLYFRLATLMGLSWTAGLIAGSLDVEPVWYVFLVLNTLQGLFILVFFTCSNKVVSSVRERLCGGGEEEGGSAWRWSTGKKAGGRSGGTLASRDSQDSATSSSSILSSTRGSNFHGRTGSITSYDHYHQYDQRFYS